MADAVTNTVELSIYLASADENATRTLKVSNPRTPDSGGGFPTLAQVKTAMAPAFASLGGDNNPIYFFYDEGNQGGYDVPMTHVTGAEVAMVTKTVHEVT